MATEAELVGACESGGDSRMRAALEAILPFARAADALARRTVGKVRGLALLGLLSAIGITAVCVYTFDWGLAAGLTLLVILVIPGATLWKLHGVLGSSVGLPQRIVDTADRAYGKTNELRKVHLDRAKPSNPLPDLTPEQKRPRFKDIWKAARTLREIKKLSDEAHELVAAAGKAIVIANPAFAVALFIASALSLLLTLIGGLVALTLVL